MFAAVKRTEEKIVSMNRSLLNLNRKHYTAAIIHTFFFTLIDKIKATQNSDEIKQNQDSNLSDNHFQSHYNMHRHL